MGVGSAQLLFFMVIISVIVELRFNALFNASVLQMAFHVSSLFYINIELTNHDFLSKFNCLCQIKTSLGSTLVEASGTFRFSKAF